MIRMSFSLPLACCIIGFTFASLPAAAQSDDFGMWMSVGATNKIDKKLSIGVEAEYRLKDNLKNTDRWSIGVSADYKIAKWLKADAGYEFMRSYNPAVSTEEENEDYEIVKTSTESYWYSRHRLHLSVSGILKTGGFRFSLRERWQYTYRPEVSFTKTKTIDDGTPSVKTKTKNGSGENVLRSRLMVEYPLKAIKLTPFVSCEMYTTDCLEKMRYSAGVEYDFNKKNSVKLYYLYNDKSDDDETNGHVVGIAYNVKF